MLPAEADGGQEQVRVARGDRVEPVMGVAVPVPATAVPAPVVPAPLHDAWDLRSSPASTDLGVRDVAWDAISGPTSPTLVPPVSLVTPDHRWGKAPLWAWGP